MYAFVRKSNRDVINLSENRMESNFVLLFFAIE